MKKHSWNFFFLIKFQINRGIIFSLFVEGYQQISPCLYMQTLLCLNSSVQRPCFIASPPRFKSISQICCDERKMFSKR